MDTLRQRISKPVFLIIFMWLAWVMSVLGYQGMVINRYEPKRPDNVLAWTPSETTADAEDDQPYLIDPFLNQAVSWDSEFYLSIALAGYDDPLVRTVPPSWRPDLRGHEPVSLNYAFFPFYPFVVRLFVFPLKLVFDSDIAAATLAGVIVSALGTLGAMLAIHDLTQEELGNDGGIRTAFYLIIFPTGFFLTMVHTEGLFVGLAFGSLAMLRRRQWIAAAVLAACATWTRAVGVALWIPMAVTWLRDMDWHDISWRLFGFREVRQALLTLAPLAAFGVWWLLFGEDFAFVEESFFGRGSLLVGKSWAGWKQALDSMGAGNPQRTVYYGIEFGAILLATAACLFTLKDRPGLSLFGLAVVVISFTSGAPQGMHRYVLAVPSIFIVLARWGRAEAFDRSWTAFSVLLMAMLAALFAFDFWVG